MILSAHKISQDRKEVGDGPHYEIMGDGMGSLGTS
jgi:hypothetical protein